MADFYSIQGTVVTIEKAQSAGPVVDYERTTQIPTFYLSIRIHGLRTAGDAARIALDILDPTRMLRDGGAEFHIEAMPMSKEQMGIAGNHPPIS